MRDLSLHILDLLENAVRAGAKTLRVTVAEDRARDLLEVAVEDDGPGLSVSNERAADPFYTTGKKRVGLGLSLFREAAEDASGCFEIAHSELGGTAVRASMRLGHVDRKPMGNLAESLFAIACTHPDTEIQCVLRRAGEERIVTRARPAPGATSNLREARHFARQIRSAAKNFVA